jgi:hypothetical protein
MRHSLRVLRLPVLAGVVSLSLTAFAGIMPASASSGPRASSHVTARGPSVPAALGQRLVSRAHRDGPARSVTDYTSHNWDGYFTTAASHATDFTAVSTKWVEPAVTCNSKNAWAGFWVGLDGWWNGSVEQGGTEAHCIHGTAHYNVWWEMFPHNDVQTSFAISPGDTIQASVTYVASSKMFDIVVRDLTSGMTLTKDTPCLSGQGGCQRSSADVISEDIGGGSAPDGLFYLPDYGKQMYSSASVTDTSGHTGPLSDSAWQLGHVNEVSSAGLTKQTTSALSSGGTAFTTTWHHQ